jgi:hypothetical protein
VVERKYRHLLERARATMTVASLPPHFWDEAVSDSTYLRRLVRRRSWHSLERLSGCSPDYSTLRLFGCVCYVLLVPRERTKLTDQSVECVFLAYNDEPND